MWGNLKGLCTGVEPCDVASASQAWQSQGCNVACCLPAHLLASARWKARNHAAAQGEGGKLSLPEEPPLLPPALRFVKTNFHTWAEGILWWFGLGGH